MKKAALIAAFAFLLMGCKKSAFHNDGVEGKWKLTEYLADPGNGSGTWQKANPANPCYLEFKNDGSLVVTGSGLISDKDRYEVKANKIIFIKGTDSLPMSYELSPVLLSIYPPCFEGCGLRYKAVK